METTLALYDPDLPVQMKNGMVLLKETVKSIENNETNFEKLSNVVVDLDRELTYGLTSIKGTLLKGWRMVKKHLVGFLLKKNKLLGKQWNF